MTTIHAHPHALLARQLARNRWRVRRILWPQTLVFTGLLLVLGAFVLTIAGPHVASLLGALLPALQHSTGFVVLGLAGSTALYVRSSLRDQERQFRQGVFAALPVTSSSRRAWLNRLAMARTALLALVVSGAFWVAAISANSSAPVWVLGALLLVAVLGGGLLGRLLVESAHSTDPDHGRAERLPASAWQYLSLRDWPHVPAFCAQWARSRWMGGRAAAGLMVLLLIAPQEAAAILVPIVGMMAWSWVNRIDLAHRSACVLQDLLSVSAPSGRRFVAALLPVSMGFAGLLAVWLIVVMKMAGLPGVAQVLAGMIVPAWVLTDTLQAVRWRGDPSRQVRLRFVTSTLMAVVISQAAPLLLLLPVLWWWLWRGLR
ncbi:MAG: hypothetical protein IPK97_19325 [Ahniella sp.]|nr:hypothetical protein [Ahniella sp.]